ncbi:uncharacterized protein STEHIDRAFT_167849 [Stereum hirsutum FP-91666 SS1]|uniref:uncharacterized protein n=1 Tax=Stereum hirsutum (strain FP-91666) TaxID=721885 RepID=UPI000440BA2A|nr:uncharacterized protein STEHIDRAFT_167849 [Stereum hirsutum FP-91666 SS1]EIM88593.1 hypothetical protein STEHIDRAFT_167849 [Stereum hirsutum FP-91666 SS1]
MSQANTPKIESNPPAAALPTPSTSTPAATPATPYSTAQWAQHQIPIDPALQQHTASSYYQYQHSHYPQASYGHYQPYIPQPQATQQQQTGTAPAVQRQTQPIPTAAPVTAAPQTQNQAQNQNQLDTADVATLNDALGSAGVDLRAEEETLQSQSTYHQTYRPYEDRSRKQPVTPNFDTRFLGPTIRSIGTKHKVTKIPDDSINYIALALRARLQELVTAMIEASAHRTDTQFDRPASMYEDGKPMWSVSVRRDVAKQLAALEKAEREEEMKIRRERKELAAQHAAALAAVSPGGATTTTASAPVEEEVEGPKKKKKKTEGPGVTAKNMSEDVRKKMSNAVASQAAGLGTGKYAWMNAANTVPAPKPKPAAPSTPSSAPSPAAGTEKGNGSGSGGAGGWARPYVSAANKSQSTTATPQDDNKRLVTLRDAMFVVGKERGHGGGRGAARGWV